MLELEGIITEDGKLQVYNQQAFLQWKRLNTSKRITLTIKVHYKRRSNPQNAYYWGVIIPLVTEGINHFGNAFTPEETHEFLKAKFNSRQVEVIDGHYLDMPQSTSKMDTREFMDFIERIQQFASMMLNIYIPSPNEQTTIDYSLNKTTA